MDLVHACSRKMASRMADILGFVYSADADADGRRDTCVFGRRVYSADGKFTICIVDLVIFACLDFREFVICGLFTFTKYKIR